MPDKCYQACILKTIKLHVSFVCAHVDTWDSCQRYKTDDSGKYVNFDFSEVGKRHNVATSNSKL